MTDYLKKYRALQAEAMQYYKEHEQAITAQNHDEKAQRIRVRLPSVLHVVSVWCRNGEVSLEAIHCEQLSCKYKKMMTDVVEGVACCQRFQVTSECKEWQYAEHIDHLFD